MGVVRNRGALNSRRTGVPHVICSTFTGPSTRPSDRDIPIVNPAELSNVGLGVLGCDREGRDAKRSRDRQSRTSSRARVAVDLPRNNGHRLWAAVHVSLVPQCSRWNPFSDPGGRLPAQRQKGRTLDFP